MNFGNHVSEDVRDQIWYRIRIEIIDQIKPAHDQILRQIRHKISNQIEWEVKDHIWDQTIEDLFNELWLTRSSSRDAGPWARRTSGNGPDRGSNLLAAPKSNWVAGQTSS